MDARVGGERARIRGIEGPAVDGGHGPTGLLDEEGAGGDVPQRQVELPEAVERALGDEGEIERRGAGAADAVRATEERVPIAQVLRRVALAIVREPAPEQGLAELGGVADPQAGPVAERAVAAPRRVLAAADGIDDDSKVDLLVCSVAQCISVLKSQLHRVHCSELALQ